MAGRISAICQLHDISDCGDPSSCFARGAELRRCVRCQRFVCIWNNYYIRCPTSGALERVSACEGCHGLEVLFPPRPPSYAPPLRMLPSPAQRWQSATEAAQATSEPPSFPPGTRKALRLCWHPHCRFPIARNPSVSEDFCCVSEDFCCHRCEQSCARDQAASPEHGWRCEGDYSIGAATEPVWPFSAVATCRLPLRRRCRDPQCGFLAVSFSEGRDDDCGGDNFRPFCCNRCRLRWVSRSGASAGAGDGERDGAEEEHDATCEMTFA